MKKMPDPTDCPRKKEEEKERRGKKKKKGKRGEKGKKGEKKNVNITRQIHIASERSEDLGAHVRLLKNVSVEPW